jgi:hypothetical protein
MRILRLAFAFTLAVAPTLADAQQFPTVPSGTVIGRTQIGPGPAQAIPFSQLIALLLQSSPTIPTLNTNSIVFKGSTSGQATLQAQAVAGTPTLNLPNTSGTIPSTATSPIVLNPTTGNISCPTCATSVSVPVLQSRAFAQSQDLSAFSAVKTLGYAQPGDGGEATFVKVGSTTPFQDTYITGATLVGGSGYTNGTYLGVPLSGGTGIGCSGSAVVSGGAIAALSIVVPCPGYKVGDVLTISNSFVGGTGSGFSYTVTSISTPQASFTDAAGNRWQFVATAVANILQFGGKGDWNGSDGSATNNSAAIWSAGAWASYQVGASLAQVNGNQILFPRGAYMTCGQVNYSTGNVSYYLPISQGVRFTGVGVGGTSLIECAADSNSVNYIELCDSNAHFGQFGCKIEDMTVYLGQVTGSTANVAAIYSNSGQQFPLAERLELQAGNRVCIRYEIGKGGASNAIFDNIDCEQISTATNDGMQFNSSGTLITLRDSVFGAGGGTATHNAINLIGGRLILDGVEIEEATTGINIATTIASDLSVLRNLTITNGCVNGIVLGSTNPNNTVLVESVTGESCSSHLVTNGHSGGSSIAAGAILAPQVFNP